ncbi:MAG: Flp pilus assembly protein CpaB [Gaiellaceae bacterium]
MEYAQKFTSTRKGSLLLGVLAAVIAGALIVVYVNRYRNSVRAEGAPVTVLAAASTIAKGTTGQTVASKSLFTVTTVRQSQLLNGAISDPSSLIGKAASRDVYAGQQLTAADFSASATALPSTLTGTQRAITIPLDQAHGLIGQLQAGEHVDIYAGFNVVAVGTNGVPLAGGQSTPAIKLIIQDVQVLGVSNPKGGLGASSGSSNITLNVNAAQAAQLAFASDNGKIWLALRPSSGATVARPALVTAETILLGVPSVTVQRSLGGHR